MRTNSINLRVKFNINVRHKSTHWNQEHNRFTDTPIRIIETLTLRIDKKKRYPHESRAFQSLHAKSNLF